MRQDSVPKDSASIANREIMSEIVEQLCYYSFWSFT